ncbi:MAG: WS/DGAT/MGAT family O-acyltransferase [Spongiibacteraceae bacterium]
MARILAPFDASFIHLESHNTPWHVAGLQIFTLPVNAPVDFLQSLVAHFRSDCDLSEPWNLKLNSSPLSKLVPSWVVDRDVDLDYHVRHLALPNPGGERELGALVSSLHSHGLNERRPLWECYIIEGLENNRFAIYTKIHHALADGVTAIRLMMGGLTTDVETLMPPPWSADIPQPKVEPVEANTVSKLTSLQTAWKSSFDVTQSLGRFVYTRLRSEALQSSSFMAPSSILNQRVTAQRRFATQHMSLARVKAIARKADATVNDVVLALCSTALRRFLKESNALPSRSLTAMVPVSVRAPGDTSKGNAVSAIMTELATDVADPLRRLEAIAERTAKGKAELNTLSASTAAHVGTMLMAPVILQLATGLSGRVRPYFNVTVSNVPGPIEPRYLMGARMEALYPVSIATHGQSLNITCTSYAGTLNFGFLACRDALPHMQRIAVYTGEALDELEREIEGVEKKLVTASKATVGA